MTVKVKSIRVRAGEKTYYPGDSISGLTKKEEKRLVDAGYCEYISSTEPADSNSKANQSGV